MGDETERTTDPELYQALAHIGCEVCTEQLGCCVGGPPNGLPKLADLILDAISDAGWRLVRNDQ